MLTYNDHPDRHQCDFWKLPESLPKLNITVNATRSRCCSLHLTPTTVAAPLIRQHHNQSTNCLPYSHWTNHGKSRLHQHPTLTYYPLEPYHRQSLLRVSGTCGWPHHHDHNGLPSRCYATDAARPECGRSLGVMSTTTGIDLTRQLHGPEHQFRPPADHGTSERGRWHLQRSTPTCTPTPLLGPADVTLSAIQCDAGAAARSPELQHGGTFGLPADLSHQLG